MYHVALSKVGIRKVLMSPMYWRLAVVTPHVPRLRATGQLFPRVTLTKVGINKTKTLLV